MFGELAKNVRRTKYVRRTTDTSSPHKSSRYVEPYPHFTYKYPPNSPYFHTPTHTIFMCFSPFSHLFSFVRSSHHLPPPTAAGTPPETPLSTQNNHKTTNTPLNPYRILTKFRSKTKITPEESRIYFRNKVVINSFWKEILV